MAADIGLFAAIDTKKRMWVWGRDGSSFPSLPTPCVDNIVDCSVADRFVLACTAEGQVVVIGRSPMGTDESKPFILPSPAAVCRVAACDASALLLTTDGAVWGAGAALTTGTGEATVAWRRLALPACAAVALGSRNGAAVAADGGRWVWGDGLSGSLGLGRRVEWAREPVQVRVTRAHTYVDCALRALECGQTDFAASL